MPVAVDKDAWDMRWRASSALISSAMRVLLVSSGSRIYERYHKYERCAKKLDNFLYWWHTFVMPKAPKRAIGPLQAEIAADLRAEVARRQVIQSSLAAAADISGAQLSELLAGKKHMDVEQLDRICFALDLKLRDVIERAEKATGSRHAERSATAVRVR